MKHFNWKIYIGILLAVFAFLPVVIFSSVSLKELISDQNELISKHSRELYLTERLRYEKERQFELLPLYIANRDQKTLDSFYDAHKLFLELAKELDELTDDPLSDVLIRQIRELDKHLFAISGPAIKMRKKGMTITEVEKFIHDEAGFYTDTFNKTVDLFATQANNNFHKARENIQKTSNAIIREFELACAIAILLAITAIILTAKVLRQKMAEDQLKEKELRQTKALSTARKETVEVVSHDLKNPLSAAKLSIDLVTGRILKLGTEDAALKRGLQMTSRSLHSMETLIGNLLDQAKIEAGQLNLSPTSCELRTFLDDVVALFVPLAEKKGITLTHDSFDSLPAIQCDQNRIEQVLSNLLGNALKFSPKGTEIRVSARIQDHNVVFSVRDHGSGIPKEQLDHIFERYWQTTDGTRRGGNGLGLAIAKAVVEAHGGRIWATSEPGQGADFIFSLPLQSHLSRSS